MPLFDFFRRCKGTLFTDRLCTAIPQLQIIASADCPAIPQGSKNAAGVTIGNLPFSAYSLKRRGPALSHGSKDLQIPNNRTLHRHCGSSATAIRGAYDDFATRGPALELEKTRAYTAFDAVLKAFTAL